MGQNYKHHYLKKTQKKLASENFPLVIWFVRTMLGKKRIKLDEIEEVTDHVMWKFIMAAENFKESEGVKFSSYAHKAMLSGLRRYEQLRNRYNQRFKVVSFKPSDEDSGEEYSPFCNIPKESSFKVDTEYLTQTGVLVSLTHQFLLLCMMGQRLPQAPIYASVCRLKFP